MIKYTLFLSTTQLKLLKNLGTGLSVSAHIRIAINKYLDELNQEKKSATSPK